MSLDSLLSGVESLGNVQETFSLDGEPHPSEEKRSSAGSGSSLIDRLLSESESGSKSDDNDNDNEDDEEDDSDDDDDNEDSNENDEDDGENDDELENNEEEEESGNENVNETEMEIEEESNLEAKSVAAGDDHDDVAKLLETASQDLPVSADIQQADDEASNIEPTPPKSKKRKRKKAAEGGEKKKKKKDKKGKKAKPGNLRRNIRDIMKDEELDADTLAAQKEEAERRRRLLEVKKALEQKMKEREEREKDSQLKSLLQMEETKSDDIILLDSSDEGKMKPRLKGNDVIELSSDEEEDDDEDDDDDVSITKEEDDSNDAETEDPNNAGSHINDELNIPDEEGRVLVNIGHSAQEEDIYLAPQIARNIKRHQIGGVRFLYDNLVESLSRYNSSTGFGCILAHSMGLGKTIQMIAFIDVFLRYAKAKTVLLIVPINTLQNWMAEFNMWCPSKEVVGEDNPCVCPRTFGVFLLNDNFKTTSARAKVIDQWYKEGGVLLMGYEMYRLLSSRRGHIADKMKKPGRKPANPVVIDVEEEYKNKGLLVGVHEALINPGPDLIVCDEGHRIKNSQAGISQSLKNIKTRRRVVLTGYPLQNNLMEYWCMVDFVRPNYLGTKTEFSNMFERPITNGQCHDSTPADEKLMRYRAHVLHSLLEGFVQRRGHTVLRDALPPKQEYIFLIRMSSIQRRLYKEFMESLQGQGLGTWASNNPLKAFAVCCKIWNHPDILYNLLNKRNATADDNDLDIETEGGPAKKSKAPKKPRVPQPVDQYYPPCDRNQEISYDWAKDLMKDYMSGLLEQGGKMVILFKLIEESLAFDDKLLVFSQSLFTLDLIEEFLQKRKVPRPDMDENWSKNRSYFRLDGSTSAQEREKLINQFNAPDNNRCWVFLLSTRAGSLGVNLVGANRVIVVDASWNPCHDCQAICRVYRFGQVKPCFIYRLVTDNTMEKKIYDRQVTKQGMSNRVVDEMQVQNHFSRRQVDNLVQYEDKDFDDVEYGNIEEEFDDPVMINVLRDEGKWFTRKPFEHESLLIDKKELRLTKKEKQLAKQSYVMEKRLNVSYTRPSYAAFYPKGSEPMRRPQIKIVNPSGMTGWPTSYPSRPVASVKPMITTPVPMQIKKEGVTPGVQLVSKNKPGVSVHKVNTTTDIMLPGTSTNTQAGAKPETSKIPAGQQIFIIKTPKGVYIRTAAGKIFAVRAKFPLLSGLGGGATSITTTTTLISTTTSTASVSSPASSPSSSEPRSESQGMEALTTTSTSTAAALSSSILTDSASIQEASNSPKSTTSSDAKESLSRMDSENSSASDFSAVPDSIRRQDSSSSLASAFSSITDQMRRQDSSNSLASAFGSVTDSIRRQDSSASLASAFNAADILGEKDSDEEMKSAGAEASVKRNTSVTFSAKPSVKVSVKPSTKTKAKAEKSRKAGGMNSRYQKIAPNLASFGAQMENDKEKKTTREDANSQSTPSDIVNNRLQNPPSENKMVGQGNMSSSGVNVGDSSTPTSNMGWEQTSTSNMKSGHKNLPSNNTRNTMNAGLQNPLHNNLSFGLENTPSSSMSSSMSLGQTDMPPNNTNIPSDNMNFGFQNTPSENMNFGMQNMSSKMSVGQQNLPTSNIGSQKGASENTASGSDSLSFNNSGTQNMSSNNMGSQDLSSNNMNSQNDLAMESSTQNMDSFVSQLMGDQSMTPNYSGYGSHMGGGNDMMQNNPFQLPSMNQNNMVPPMPYMYQNQMMYNPSPYSGGPSHQSQYGGANSMGYGDPSSSMSSGMPQNMPHVSANSSMQNSSMQGMGMPNMASMAPMPMQHSMLGFPFAPYPFPMPGPYLMGSMDPNYMSHMPMGQGGGYMPQGMGMSHGHMGMGMPQNTMNISSFQHGSGGSVSSGNNPGNMREHSGNQ